ncbi:hypothetical protein ACW73L_19480 [Methylolobus aquaticus]
MRRVFQFDGMDGGVLSVGECEQEAKVAICLHQGDKEVQLFLSEEQFGELAGLRFTLRYPRPATGESAALKAA